METKVESLEGNKVKVTVTVDGDSRVLTDGEMALVSGLESHAYTIRERADIAYSISALPTPSRSGKYTVARPQPAG